jgi:hypothetical protein
MPLMVHEHFHHEDGVLWPDAPEFDGVSNAADPLEEYRLESDAAVPWALQRDAVRVEHVQPVATT